MKVGSVLGTLAAVGLVVGFVGPLRAGETPPVPTPTPCPYATPEPDDPPVFVHFLRPEDPRDRAIREYWERAQACEATPEELVDLGTLLFERKFPRDALRMFRAAAALDPVMAEAWFRAGMVHQSLGELGKARKAYRKCLKIFKGHAWCNFYLGLASEESGKTSDALHYYRKAFKYNPALADPRVNPAVLQSRLQVAAALRAAEAREFTSSLPMELLNPAKVEPESPKQGAGAAPAASGAGSPTRSTAGRPPRVQPRLKATPAAQAPPPKPTPKAAPPKPPRPMRRVPRVPTVPTPAPPGSSGADVPQPPPTVPAATPEPATSRG